MINLAMGWSKFQPGLMLLSREVNPCRFIFYPRTLTAPGKQHVPRRFFVWDFEDGHIQGPRPQSPCDKGGLLLLESMLYFRKCWVLCTSLLQACLAKVCLDLTLPYSLLRLRSWVENKILNLGQSTWWYHSGPTLRWLYSLYNAFLYINFRALVWLPSFW